MEVVWIILEDRLALWMFGTLGLITLGTITAVILTKEKENVDKDKTNNINSK